ncbi:uncharacterized protein LOC113036816 isoform X1 [Astatotilapia calliptera]|uniref:uncharacterized protein LOC113036816 isoform X1 n=1 Tax=Astatotilapia calliptera TaxID=8154 RepID=UPI000E403C79|nr:uncharacterized protein LOC113036816 isoform X1 [Astatotilapia calliptera]
MSEYTTEVKDLPTIEAVDITNYLVLQTSYYTRQQMKAFKSLEAYNFFVSGWVHNLGTKRLRDGYSLVFARIWKMQVPGALLFLVMGSISAKKVGDFGVFTACIDTKENNSLRLQCYYQDCSQPPYMPFSCEFKTSNGGILATMKNTMCKNYTVPLTEHSLSELQETGNVTNFTCTLTRNKRTETKNITIDYKAHKEKQRVPKCCAASPTSLWPVVLLTLWRVVDS